MKALRTLIGSDTRVKILVYLSIYKESYPREITINLRLPLFGVQTQLKNLLTGGVVLVKKDANRQMFSFNPKYPMKKELLALLKAGMDSATPKEKNLYLKPKLTPKSTIK